jgi:hypothetical protein
MDTTSTELRMKRESRKRWNPAKLRPLLILTTLSIINPTRAYAALVGDEPNELSDIEPIVANIIKSVVTLGGIALFAMLVFGGIQYLTSGGDPEGIQKAKHTLTYAIIGIALFVIAWFVLLFIETFTGVKVTLFNIEICGYPPLPPCN